MKFCVFSVFFFLYFFHVSDSYSIVRYCFPVWPYVVIMVFLFKSMKDISKDKLLEWAAAEQKFYPEHRFKDPPPPLPHLS